MTNLRSKSTKPQDTYSVSVSGRLVSVIFALPGVVLGFLLWFIIPYWRDLTPGPASWVAALTLVILFFPYLALRLASESIFVGDETLVQRWFGGKRTLPLARIDEIYVHKARNGEILRVKVGGRLYRMGTLQSPKSLQEIVDKVKARQGAVGAR